jgi:hypothetical protein
MPMFVIGLSLADVAPSGGAVLWRTAASYSGELFLPTVRQEVTGARVTLIADDAVWQYWDAEETPASDWRQPDSLDAAAWPAGAAPLGYGTTGETTPVSFGPDPSAKPITVYFRHVFTVTAPNDYKALDMQMLRDDGALVYLNGQEALRSNLPTGEIDPFTRAVATVSDDAEMTIYHYTLDPALLRQGVNVLAVEVHQAAPDSPDLRFALNLTASSHGTVRFAVIGDYGEDSPAEADVAARVKVWRPDFVITTGDNNYEEGAAATMDANVLKHYGEFITDNSATTRFFPSLGNHDWITADAQAYFDTFTLPGNERYYDFVRGNVHFFVLDSDSHEPDGVTADSVQGRWFSQAITASTARWRIVYFHHPPRSSGRHGSSARMQWPFDLLGAHAVLTGHDHIYERLAIEGVAYFVNGLGGSSRHRCPVFVPVSLAAFSRICYNADYGAMLVETSGDALLFSFISRADAVIDTCTLPGTCER